MANRLASVDDVINVFDQAIEKWAQSKFKDLSDTYGPDEATKMTESLIDFVYSDIDLDPNHLQRFVDFYVNDVRLSDAFDEFLDGFSEDVAQVATSLKTIANSVQASEKPQKDKVVKDLKAIIAMIHK